MAKRVFGLILGPAIAVGVQQDLAGGEDGALAIMLNRAAFQHEAELLHRRASEPGDVVAHAVVAGKVELSSPAVELESQRNHALPALRKYGAGIAEPDVSVFRRHDLSGAAEARAG